jgi:hypothetical protein
MSMPPDADDINCTTDDKMLRWVGAIALLVAIHAGWMLFAAWYMHLDERGFLFGCADPERPGGWIGPALPECPPERPYADFIKWVVPIIGLLVSSFLPPVAFRIPIDGFSAEGGRNFTAWLIFCVVVPIVVGVIVTVWFVG